MGTSPTRPCIAGTRASAHFWLSLGRRRELRVEAEEFIDAGITWSSACASGSREGQWRRVRRHEVHAFRLRDRKVVEVANSTPCRSPRGRGAVGVADVAGERRGGARRRRRLHAGERELPPELWHADADTSRILGTRTLRRIMAWLRSWGVDSWVEAYPDPRAEPLEIREPTDRGVVVGSFPGPWGGQWSGHRHGSAPRSGPWRSEDPASRGALRPR